MSDADGVFDAMVGWCPHLFMAGGLLVIGFAAVEAYGVVVAGDPVRFPDPRSAFLSGYALGFLGLLGVYPRVADRSPWLARLGGLTAALGAVGFSLATVLAVSRLAGVGPARSSYPEGFALVVGLFPVIGFLVGYLSLGVGSLWTEAYPRQLGVLLTAPSLLFALNIALAVVDLSPWSSPVIATGEAVAIFLIGYSLWSESPTADHPERREATA